MRFLAVILVAATLLGSVALCQYGLTRQVRVHIAREPGGHGGSHKVVPSQVFRLELTTTFDAGEDPFAVQTGDAAPSARLTVRGPDGPILAHTGDIRRGERIEVNDLALEGDALDLFVEGTPTPEEAVRACAVRLRILNADGAVCDDHTIWSEGGGSTVAGTVHLSLRAQLESVDRGLGEESVE